MTKFAAIFSALFIGIFLTACASSKLSGTENPAAARQEEARDALHSLYSTTPGAAELARSAKGILVFPNITKAGLIVGGQFGKGVLFKNGEIAGYYNSVAASYGLQAGVQRFGYALFFMKDSDLDYLSKSDGWEVGVGPTVTVVDKGFASSMTTTTGRQGVYAFFFEQRGLMAGLGIQGTQISKSEAAG